MMQRVFFQESFLISGIMCYQGCGVLIQGVLRERLEQGKKDGTVPQSTRLIMDAEPHTLGIHRIFITLECDDSELKHRTEEKKKHLLNQLKEDLASGGVQIIAGTPQEAEIENTQGINILINVLAIMIILGLTCVLPASLPLTIGLTLLSCITSACTARDYLINFVRNIRTRNSMDRTTTISLGWLLSFIHTLYHSVSMPLASTFPMIFMGYIMPITLILLINGMDEMKRWLINKSKKIQLHSAKTLFPEMAEEYECCELTKQEQSQIAQWVAHNASKNGSWQNRAEFLRLINNTLGYMPNAQNRREPHQECRALSTKSKNALTEGMIIRIKRGACFPVDCVLLQDSTVVDASILTGENQQSKQCLDFIPAGAVNLGQAVSVYSVQCSYNSAVNQILFRSHRASEKTPPATNYHFTYLYTALLVIGICAALLVPWCLGIMTIPLLLQNSMGILFSVCPCTIAIAHELPNILNIYRRARKGIILREKQLSNTSHEIHTVVFDKTGTLTTGKARVKSFEGISAALWERIYLLEKKHGADHPLAKAINQYYETQFCQPGLIQDINHLNLDPQGRGLSAVVQKKHIHIGNKEYLGQLGIKVPEIGTENQVKQGVSPVYVAEDKKYQGAIYIEHEVRKGILPALLRLKEAGKTIIMLTGDALSAAKGFNRQNGSLFDEDTNTFGTAQTPAGKEKFIRDLMNTPGIKPEGVWFVGDGLNDAPCARMVTEKGGVSCAISSDTKAAFFADISLNGSLDYLFVHNKLNQLLNKSLLQNQCLLFYGVLTFLACVISFSIVGIAVSALIPLIIMIATTLFVLFNSYRAQLTVDIALDKEHSVAKRVLASDVSLGLLIGASFLLLCSVIISTVVTGGLALPVIAFTGTIALAISSSCLLAASVLFGLFGLLVMTHFCSAEEQSQSLDEPIDLVNTPIQKKQTPSPKPLERDHPIIAPIFNIHEPVSEPKPVLLMIHDPLRT